MRLDQKVYWKIRNSIDVWLIEKSKSDYPVGCLAHKKDKRDYEFGGIFTTRPKYPEFSLLTGKYIFDQRYLNICVFASGVIGDSYQEGIRFSVKFAVKLAKKLKMTTGNGYSYLRAYREIATKYGRLPYEFMPDEVNCSWEEYSKNDITDEQMAIAAQYKAPAYKKITSNSAAVEAIESGHALFTANTWYSSMNSPRPKDFYLSAIGSRIGGHAWGVEAYRSFSTGNAYSIKDWETLQTFGSGYGNNGKARIANLFDRNNFEVYIHEKLPNRTDQERFLALYDGILVKGSGVKVYEIRDGFKRHIESIDALNKLGGKFFYVDQSILDGISDGEPIS